MKRSNVGTDIMKVAIVSRYFLPVRGGIENHCYNLARELSKKGIEVVIHASKDTLTKSNVLKELEIIDGIKVYRHKNFWRFISKNYDIIHLHNFNIFPHFLIFLTIFTKRLFKMETPKLIITPHGGFTPWWSGFSTFAKIVKLAYHKTLGKLFINYIVDKIIAVGELEKEQLIKEGIKSEKIVVIPNGVEEEAYTLSKSENPKLAEFKPYLLFISRISQRKNLEFIIKCMKAIEGIKLLIAGPVHEINYYNYLKKLISRLNLQDKVFFVGEVNTKLKYSLIDNALAIVLISKQETEPIVVKEAMARGKPVIVSDIPPMRYLIKNGENGFIISNEKEFINVVKELVENAKLVRQISENNKKISKKWRWCTIVAQIIEAYRGLV